MKTKPDVITILAALSTGYQPDIQQEQQETTYYDYPVLKPPVWRWEIVWYFYLGGLAAGSYILASLATLFGSPEDHHIARVGFYASLLALLPCPPLLIKDLGRPEKFLNMLRVFKVRSPMSMGVWGIMTFSLFSGLSAVIQAAQDNLLGTWWGATFLRRLPQRLIVLPGLLFGFFLGGYTGVLLASTSVPLWSRSKLMGALFISSALSTGTALLSLVLRLISAPVKTLHKLEYIEWVNMSVELVSLLAFLRGSGRAAQTLVSNRPQAQGPTFWRFMFGGGLLLPWLLQTMILLTKGHKAHSRQDHKGLGIVISLLVLLGGYFLRRTMVNAGHTASKDARTTLWNAK